MMPPNLLNPYLDQCTSILPRLLALYDVDPVSPTYGMGDRYRWAWKLIDFGNGTFQGAAHGLSRLMVNNLLPDGFSQVSMFKRIDAMFHGARKLTRNNGSLEEAFPYESSFCVTALIAYDLLSTIEMLSSILEKDKRKVYFSIIEPMISFLHRADETHAFISNHLATAAAALFKWADLTGERGEERGQLFLDRIIRKQSCEGWFWEYDGADPGYQTLCTYYLSDIHRLNSDSILLDSLRRSIQFLWYFAHPDGSFGGMYGSRNTRFYFPAGIEALAGEIPEAEALALFMRQSVAKTRTVTLATMDEPNLVPMFNAYCYAAAIVKGQSEIKRRKELKGKERSEATLPCHDKDIWSKHFPDAGIFIDKGVEHYTIISHHKGGVCYHFVGDAERLVDTGRVVRNKTGGYFSTQAFNRQNTIEVSEESIIVDAQFSAIRHQLPTPFQFMILRFLSLTAFRSFFISKLIKKMLVRLLITGKRFIKVANKRVISLQPKLSIADSFIGNTEDLTKISVNAPFSAIHMASHWYWQIQDEK